MTESSTTCESRWFFWNLRLHLWLGLFLLLFLWLFAVSGLILNHPRWEFAHFWQTRQETTTTPPVQLPAEAADSVKIHELVRQLGLRGETELIASKPDRFEFRVTQPGVITTVSIKPGAERATVKQIRINTWGIVNQLHSFNGARGGNLSERRDWAWSWVWTLAMDGTAVALLLLILGGFCVWYQRKEQLLAGFIVLVLGCVACGFFVFGLG